MLVAQQKRQENIAEYLLYMFQIEDLIRAFNFDIEEIDLSLVSEYDEDYETKREIRKWYRSIISMMKENNLETSGHIPLLQGLINSLNDIHIDLIQNKKEKEYLELYNETQPLIEELRVRGGDPSKNDIEICLNGLYGLLMLKIQKKEINPATEKAFERISRMLAVLSHHFHEMETGKQEY
jgi:hypothetical protein